MKLENLQSISDKQFRRIVGVKRKTFAKMIEIGQNAYDKEKAMARYRGGRKPKLDMANKILMTLEYLREYRTYANIGITYGLSETRAFETIRWIENVLIRSSEFRLPGKKALLRDKIEVALVDVAESPIERPKKNRRNFIQEKRSVIL